jgi:hypothetical protein
VWQQTTIVESDKIGGYAIRLDHCEYQFARAVGPGGKELRIHRQQTLAFVHSSSRMIARFALIDVMLSR